MAPELAWIDWVCPVSMVVAFLAAVPWGRRAWWLVDAAANATFGLGLIFIPQFIMGFQVSGKLDDLHLHFCRITGTIMLSSAASFYLCRNSVDYRMFGSHLFSRIVTCTFLLIAQTHSVHHLWYKSGHKFNEKYVSFSCVGVALWLLGSVVQLLRYKEYGGYIHKNNKLHVGLLVDSFMLLVFSVVNFAFPAELLKAMVNTKFKIDGVHICFSRCMAAMLLGQSWLSNACQGFLYMDDKRAHVVGRLLIQVLALAVNIFSYFHMQGFGIDCTTPFLMNGLYVMFVLWLYFRTDQKDKEH